MDAPSLATGAATGAAADECRRARRPTEMDRKGQGVETQNAERNPEREEAERLAALLPPFSRALGVRLTGASAACVTAELEVRAQMANRNGVMHGGAIMAFADTLGGVGGALNIGAGQITTTVESKTNFLRPIPIGSLATGRCETLHAGGRTSVHQITLYRQDGKPAAVVTQTQMILEARG